MIARLTVIAALVFMALQPAHASWQLRPGVPMDPPYPATYQPCWNTPPYICAYSQRVYSQTKQQTIKHKTKR
jgi:hypothetical protein